MKIAVIFLVFLVGAIAIYTWHFPLWFNYVLSGENQIDVVIQKLGEPDKVTGKGELHTEITSNEKNHGADSVYYWSNGASSYHYVVTTADGEIINYSSEGW